MKNNRDSFSSKLGFVFAAAGSAVDQQSLPGLNYAQKAAAGSFLIYTYFLPQ